MSVIEEVRRAYTERTRMLDFRASRPVRAKSLRPILATIGQYNRFNPKRVADAIISVDPSALVYVGREGSVVLYIKTKPSLESKLRSALHSVKVDELHKHNPPLATSGGWIRAWWD